MYRLIGLINGFTYFEHNKEQIKNMPISYKIPFIILIIFILWTFISCIFADNKYLSLIGSLYRHDGFLSYLCYIGFFVNGLIISNNKTYLHNCFKILILGSIFLGLGLFVRSIIPITDNNISIYTTIFNNENHYAYYLTITIIASLFFAIYENKLYSIVFIFFSFILIKNDTFGSYIAVFLTLFVVALFFFVKKEKRILISLLCLSFISISLLNKSVIRNFISINIELAKIFENKKDLNNIYIENVYADDEVKLKSNENEETSTYLLMCAGNSRLDLWLKGLTLANKKPIFGYGLENLEKPYHDLLVCHKTDRPHNTFLQILMTTGYVGLFLWLSFLLLLFLKIVKNIHKINNYLIMSFAIILCYLISSCFGNSMFYTTPYFIFILGITSSIFRTKELHKETK